VSPLESVPPGSHLAAATPPPECGATDRKSAVLIVTRNLGQAVRVGDDVHVVVMEFRGSQVRFGIERPPNVPLYRDEATDEERERYRIGAEDQGTGEE